MAPTTLSTALHDDTPARPLLALRRAAAVTAIAALGLLAPAAAGAAPGETPPAPTAPGGFSAGQPEPDDCDPRLGSCDIAIPEADPEDCPPPAASCDITTGEPDPEDPGDPGDPGDVESSADPLPQAGVDAPVHATPNYTG